MLAKDEHKMGNIVEYFIYWQNILIIYKLKHMRSTIGTGVEWAMKRGLIFMWQICMPHKLPNTGDLFELAVAVTKII